MEIRFYRDAPLRREERALPAETYNLTRVLLARAREGCVFVPIRTMQYLAVIDAEEIIFTHREAAREVEIAWSGFRPDERAGIADPVRYQALYYRADAAATMTRLQGEFLVALRLLDSRRAPARDGDLLSFPGRREPGG